jgi:hypothetical protein
MKDWQVVLIFIGVAIIIFFIGFSIGISHPRHIVKFDTEVEGVVRSIMELEPQSWNLSYNEYYNRNSLRMTIKNEDLEIEILDKKKLSEIQEELLRLKDYLK